MHGRRAAQRLPRRLVTGSACTPDGISCVYPTDINDHASCYCQGGAWNCEPVISGDAAADASAE